MNEIHDDAFDEARSGTRVVTDPGEEWEYTKDQIDPRIDDKAVKFSTRTD